MSDMMEICVLCGDVVRAPWPQPRGGKLHFHWEYTVAVPWLPCSVPSKGALEYGPPTVCAACLVTRIDRRADVLDVWHKFRNLTDPSFKQTDYVTGANFSNASVSLDSLKSAFPNQPAATSAFMLINSLYLAHVVRLFPEPHNATVEFVPDRKIPGVDADFEWSTAGVLRFDANNRPYTE